MAQDKQDKGMNKLMRILLKEKVFVQETEGVGMVLKDYSVQGLDSDRISFHVKYHDKETRMQVFGDYAIEYNNGTKRWKEVKGD